jgi:hypothetical protein
MDMFFLRSTGDSQLFEKTVVQDVEPTDNSVQNHPQNRMIAAPRDCDRQHTSEASLPIGFAFKFFSNALQDNPHSVSQSVLSVASIPSSPRPIES